MRIGLREFGTSEDPKEHVIVIEVNFETSVARFFVRPCSFAICLIPEDDVDVGGDTTHTTTGGSG